MKFVHPDILIFQDRLRRSSALETEEARARFEADPEAVRAEADAAWPRRAEDDTFLRAAEGMRAAGQMRWADSERLAIALLLRRRFAEAKAVMEAPRHRFDPQGQGQDPVDLANYGHALAGLGRFEAASWALGVALAAKPDLAPALALSSKLDGLRQQAKSIRRHPSWPKVRQVQRDYLTLNQAELAYEATRSLLAFGIEPQEAQEVCEGVRSLLPFLDAARARGLVLAMKQMPAPAASLAAIDAAVAVMDAGTGFVEAGESDPLSEAVDFCLAEALLRTAAKPAAVRLLGQMAARHEKANEIRIALARAVGDEVLSHVDFSGAAAIPPRPRKVFDVFRFNDEIDMLRIRLHEMAPWVDHFVIVESRETFTGLPKPLYFEENRELFEAFAPKIIHRVIDRWPDHIASNWSREYYQRDVGLAAIADIAHSDDLILLSDTDEIVDHRALEGFQGEFAHFKMRTYMYFLNFYQTLDRHDQRSTGSVFKMRHLRRMGSSYARHMLPQYKLNPVLFDTGWHFTSVGDPVRLAAKMQAYSHQEYADRDEVFFLERMEKIRRKKRTDGFAWVPIDESFPRFIRKNKKALADYIL